MFEDLKKQVDKGVEYAFMNAEKLAQAAKDLAKENKLSKEEAKKLYDYLLSKSEDVKKTVEAEVQQIIKTTLKKMDVANKDDIKKLEQRIANLEKGAKPGVKPRVSSKKAEPAGKTAKKPATKAD